MAHELDISKYMTPDLDEVYNPIYVSKLRKKGVITRIKRNYCAKEIYLDPSVQDRLPLESALQWNSSP